MGEDNKSIKEQSWARTFVAFVLVLSRFRRNLLALALSSILDLKFRAWRACNLTGFINSSTSPVVHPFAPRHEGPEFNPQAGT